MRSLIQACEVQNSLEANGDPELEYESCFRILCFMVSIGLSHDL